MHEIKSTMEIYDNIKKDGKDSRVKFSLNDCSPVKSIGE